MSIQPRFGAARGRRKPAEKHDREDYWSVTGNGNVTMQLGGHQNGSE
jgi:hypothetical protein